MFVGGYKKSQKTGQ